MPLIQGSTSVPAAGTVANVLAGSAYEYLPRNAIVEIGLVDEAAGDLRCTVQSGSDVLMEESPVSMADRMPIYPDDFPLEDTARGGERLVVRARNTNPTTAAVLRWAIRLAWI